MHDEADVAVKAVRGQIREAAAVLRVDGGRVGAYSLPATQIVSVGIDRRTCATAADTSTFQFGNACQSGSLKNSRLTSDEHGTPEQTLDPP